MKFTKAVSIFTCAAMSLSILTACGGNEGEAENTTAADTTAAAELPHDAVVSALDAPTDKIKIVIECQQSRMREEFEKAVENKFPDIDLIINFNYSNNVRYALAQSLTHGVAADIVMYEALPNIGEEMLENYFYDLSAESFVNNYYLNAIKGCTTASGGLYYLPGPTNVYGIVYDKTAFKELGLSVPKNYSEFAALIQTVKDMNLTGIEPDPVNKDGTVEVPVEPFVPTIKWADMFQIIFNTINYEDSFRGIGNAKWLSDYQAGEASLVGHFDGATEKYLKMFDDGVLSLDFWETKPYYRSMKLYKYHTSLMTIECQQGNAFNEKYGATEPENKHEVGIMPIYTSDEPDSGYLYGIPRCYFGITKQGAADPQKLEAMLRIFDYLSTVEGQTEVVSGTDYFGYLKEDVSFESDFYAEVADIINSGRIITTFYLGGPDSYGKVENYLHANTPALVKGEITAEQWLKGADEVRDNLLNPEPETVYGTVTETLVPMQSAYVGGLALKYYTGADIGMMQVSQDYGTLQYMFSGDITDVSINFASPEISNTAKGIEGDMEYVVVEMTGEQILDCVEKNDPLCRVALGGVEMEIDRSKSKREQYISFKINGEEMDMSKTYRVASIRGVVAEYTPVEEFKDVKFIDIFKKYLSEAAGGVINPPEDLKIIA